MRPVIEESEQNVLPPAVNHLYEYLASRLIWRPVGNLALGTDHEHSVHKRVKRAGFRSVGPVGLRRAAHHSRSPPVVRDTVQRRGSMKAGQDGGLRAPDDGNTLRGTIIARGDSAVTKQADPPPLGRPETSRSVRHRPGKH